LARRPPPRAQIPLYDWHDDGIGGPVAIKIDLTRQRLTAYRGDRPIGWSVVATGIPGHSTPAGHYKVSEKVEDKYSTLYGVIKNAEGITINRDAKMGRDAIPPGCQFVPAPMPYWQRLSHTAFGMHAGPIPHPGRPASHGCIRLPRETAVRLFGITEIGTPINVVP
jgi:lipoprotein-anchoring transpeptidase ErfK/SrfK